MSKKPLKILVTGAAGFIGFTLTRKLLAQGHQVLGLDNLNDYYDVNLKKSRLQILQATPGFKFFPLDITDRVAMPNFFATERPERVMHLAAQAGVRYSLENPFSYLDNNLGGYLNILEGCRHNGVEHLVYASTSSVYGLNTNMPFEVKNRADHPVSLYGATKRANELMAHSYSHLFALPTTGLRFFTVYGPWGRPDMALFLFAKNILAGKPIDVFNGGNHHRDFTYVDDIVEGLQRILTGTPPSSDSGWDPKNPNPASSSAPYRVYNIGNNNSVSLLRYIEVLESCLQKKAIRNLLPIQAGDVAATHANVDDLARDYNYRPNTSIETGIGQFVAWYRSYYKA